MTMLPAVAMGSFWASESVPNESPNNITLRRLAYEQAVKVMGETVAELMASTHESVFRWVLCA